MEVDGEDSDGLEGFTEDGASEQIAFEQTRTDPCLDRDEIKILIHDILGQTDARPAKWTGRAVDALHAASESYLIQMLGNAQDIAATNSPGRSLDGPKLRRRHLRLAVVLSERERSRK